MVPPYHEQHKHHEGHDMEPIHPNDKTWLRPTEVAPDTFLIHDHEGEGTAPVCVPLNSMVIRGREPVVVDTGMHENRDRWFEDVFSIVEPGDVRWLFVSHDDVDHTGNVNELMARCPNATLITNWFMITRMGATLEVPPTRWRWISDGESFDVGDRMLHAVRPPIFDSPTTRGLFDPTTGVYWASDSFATPMPAPVHDVAELDADFWQQGIWTFDNYVSPWLAMVDDARFQRTVDRVEALDPTLVVGCHTPVVSGANVAKALATSRRSPVAAFDPEPDQAVLDEIQATLGQAA
jgi:flavorubredoxin